MTQNVYDDEQFFAEYGRLPRSIGGLSGAPEWPVSAKNSISTVI
jgi:hypothetical protein